MGVSELALQALTEMRTVAATEAARLRRSAVVMGKSFG